VPPSPDLTTGFPCVYHHSENPKLDQTPDCKTRHKYVSELRCVCG
jgi:hypothetical protein